MSSAERFVCEPNHAGPKACEEKKCCFDEFAGYWDVACYYPTGKIIIIIIFFNWKTNYFFIIIIITASKQQFWLVAVGEMGMFTIIA